MDVPSHPAKEDPPGAVERLMLSSIPLWVFLLAMLAMVPAVIVIGSLAREPERYGVLGRAVVAVTMTPRTIGDLFKGPKPFAVEQAPGHAPQALPNGFSRNGDQPLVDPGYALITVFDEGRGRPVIHLVRLSDGAVRHVYVPDVQTINDRSSFHSDLINLRRDRNVARFLPMHPILLPDGGLLVHDTGPLARIDACGKVVWELDGIFHHSVEQDGDGTFWAAYSPPRSREPGVGPGFSDNSIVGVTADGKILRKERIADILDRNGLGRVWRSRPYTDDPFHLNDIQPVLQSGPYWRRGDLFISLRNLSLVMLYRPSTGRIVWRRNLPWRFQHDVSLVDDHRISIFDNNWRFDYTKPEHSEINGVNRLLIYDFATDRVSAPFAAAFQNLDIRTRAQGRATPLPNGDFMIEETEQGRLMRLSPEGVVRWRYVSADRDDRRLQLRWSRYLDTQTFSQAIKTAEHARCD